MSSGRCLCGAVTFRAEGEPLTIRQCWCRDCQALAAGGATHNVFYPTERVTIAGDLRWFESVADSGATLGRGFCPECGTPIVVQSHARRHLIALRVGAFDEREPLAPQGAIWTGSAPSWAMIDPALPQTERQPPPLA